MDQACGLHAVGYCTGNSVAFARIAGEGLRQSATEELGGLQDAKGDAGRFFAIAIAPQTERDERIVEWPDGAHVIPNGIVAPLSLGHRPDPPAGEETCRS